MFLLNEVSCSRLCGFLSSSGLCGLPASFKCFFTVFFICVFDNCNRLRCEHLQYPGYVLCLLVQSFGFGPQIKIKDSLQNVVMLHFLIRVFWSFGQTLVGPEYNVRYVKTVYAFFREYHFVIIENFESESPRNFPWQILAILQKSNIYTSHYVVDHRLNYFLFKYNSILPGLVSICVLDWLRTYDFIKRERILLWLHINLNLTLRCVIWHHTFNDECVTIIILG